MDNYSTYRALTPLQFATVMDSAKQRATQARREAMNDFWDAVAQQMRSAWRAVTQVVQRHGKKAVTRPAIR
jgi:leucyl aminopeptidase (aminopeptidase T)